MRNEVQKYGKAYHEVFSPCDGSLIVSTVHEESAEDTETEPHDGTQIDNGGQDAEHNPEHPDYGTSLSSCEGKCP